MPNHAHKIMYGEHAPSITVKVTKAHIADAIQCHGAKCMISEAVADAYGRDRALYVNTDMKCIQFSDPERDRRFLYFHSNKTLKAMLDFDAGKTVKPFSFQLRDGQVRARNHGNTKGLNRPRKPTRRPGSRGVRKFGVCLYTPKAALASRHAK